MASNQSLRLAIVDDDEGARTGLARLLRSLGHEVQAFESAEAVEAAGAARLAVDCLIVDVRLPGVSGPELRDRLRSRGTLTPVVFITGDADTKTRDAARTVGAVTVIKPFDDEMLLAAVARAMSAAPCSSAHHVR